MLDARNRADQRRRLTSLAVRCGTVRRDVSHYLLIRRRSPDRFAASDRIFEASVFCLAPNLTGTSGKATGLTQLRHLAVKMPTPQSFEIMESSGF